MHILATNGRVYIDTVISGIWSGGYIICMHDESDLIWVIIPTCSLKWGKRKAGKLLRKHGIKGTFVEVADTVAHILNGKLTETMGLGYRVTSPVEFTGRCLHDGCNIRHAGTYEYSSDLRRGILDNIINLPKEIKDAE